MHEYSNSQERQCLERKILLPYYGKSIDNLIGLLWSFLYNDNEFVASVFLIILMFIIFTYSLTLLCLMYSIYIALCAAPC